MMTPPPPEEQANDAADAIELASNRVASAPGATPNASSPAVITETDGTPKIDLADPRAEILIAPGELVETELNKLRFVQFVSAVSREDLVHVCSETIKGATHSHISITWRNGTSIQVDEVAHLWEVQELSEVDTVHVITSYCEGSNLALTMSGGIILVLADSDPEKVARKRFHELNILIRGLERKVRLPRGLVAPEHFSQYLLGAGFGMALGFMLFPLVAAWWYVVLEAALIAVGFWLTIRGIRRGKKTRPRWLVAAYSTRRRINWELFVGFTSLVVAILAWVLPTA